MKNIALVGAFLALTACTDSEMKAAREADRKDQAWIYEMQRRVERNLKDPASAEFREVKLSRKGGLPAVCGQVNSKNSFGGMTGYQRFIAAGDIQVLEEQMPQGELQKVWDQFC